MAMLARISLRVLLYDENNPTNPTNPTVQGGLHAHLGADLFLAAPPHL